MIMRDDQGGCSQDNPPDIQVRGVTHRAAKRRIRTGLSGSIILYEMYQIIPQINDLVGNGPLLASTIDEERSFFVID